MKKKLIITGAAGFIGSEFARQAVAKGYKVTVIDNLSYAGDMARLLPLKHKITFCKADICDRKKVAACFAKEKPSLVAHFAAESHVDRSILGSDEFIESNVKGTMVMLDCSRQAGVERFVHVSTDEVYGDIEKGQFFETTPFNPSSPYSASKAAADLLVKSYVRTFKFPALTVRPSNNYGPWQYPEKFVPVIIYKALHDEKIPVYGRGINVREWLYVSDCASAVLRVMERGRIGEAYNIGSGNERRNIDVAKTILDILGKPHSLIEFVQDRPGHDIRYSLNFNKIKKELSWKPAMPFEKGMRETVAWYEKNARWMTQKREFLTRYWKQVYKK